MGNLALTSSASSQSLSFDFALSSRNLAEVASYLGPINPGSGEWAKILVTDVTSDSKSVNPGSLFVALPGITHHDQDFEIGRAHV